MKDLFAGRRILIGLCAGFISMSHAGLSLALSLPAQAISLKQKILNSRLILVGKIEGIVFRGVFSSSQDYGLDFSENNEEKDRAMDYYVRTQKVLWNRSETKVGPLIRISHPSAALDWKAARKSQRIFFIKEEILANTPKGVTKIFWSPEEGMGLESENDVRKLILEIRQGNRL